MSLYRFVRLTALLTLARRYRARLVRIVFAVALAFVTSWLYGDVASYLDLHRPQWSGAALVIKTLVVFSAFLLSFWELSRLVHGDDGQPANVASKAEKPRKKVVATEAAPTSAPPSVLDQLAEKPQLRSRRDGILDE